MALRTFLRNWRFVAHQWLYSYPEITSLNQLCIQQQHQSTSTDKNKKKPRKNEEISASIVRLVQANGSHRIIPTIEALQEARDAGLDLIEVSPESSPPVVRVLDGFEIDRQKHAKEKASAKKARERQKQEKAKEIRFTPRISNHDLEQKVKKINQLLDHGYKVHVMVMTPTLADQKMGYEALQYLQTLLEGRAKISLDSEPNKQGNVAMTLTPLQETPPSKATQKSENNPQTGSP